MPRPNPKRVLSLRFDGEAIRDHSISVSLFTKSLDSVQKLLLHLTESRLEREPRTQGRISASIAAECELFLQSIEANCVTAKLTLPEMEESLFPDLPDLSENVLADARSSFIHYSRAEYAPFLKLCPKPIYRKWVLHDLGGIAPTQKSDYSLHFVGNDNREYKLIKPPQDQLRVMLKSTVEEIPEIVEESRLVSAKGMAVLKGNNIIEWKETYDIMELDLDTIWRPHHISWGGCHLKLIHPVAVVIEERNEELFVATFDLLGISAFGTTREETMEAFAQEFVVLWKEIAEEDDPKLSQDAVELKRKLQCLVESENLV